jgi:hypothetical protein
MSARTSIILRSIYAVCLLGATATHVRLLGLHGPFWNYGGAPVISCIYWTSLTLLDPLAAVLLFLKPPAGLLLTLAIIITDVAHNTWILSRSPSPDWQNWMYVSQITFLMFVTASMLYAWRGVPVTETPPLPLSK